MELSAILQKILLTNDFVSLPGLGSFVRRYDSARMADDGKTLLPPREYFVFDTNRIFNDEAIENFLVERQGISHSEAQKIIEEFCKQVKNKLENNQDIEFQGLGFLRKSPEGRPILDVEIDNISSTYGLNPIEVDFRVRKEGVSSNVPQTAGEMKVAPIHHEGSESVGFTKGSSEIASKRNRSLVLPIILVILVAGLAAIVVFVPSVRIWEQMGQAGTMSQASQAPVSDTQVEPSETDIKLDGNEPVAQIVESSTPVNKGAVAQSAEGAHTSAHVSDFSLAPIDKKAALTYQERVNEQPKTYYIIVGSFSNQQNAQRLMERLTSKGYRPVLIPGNNIYRVSIYQFSNHERALRELERVRSLQLTDKAWLLSQ